MKQPIFQDRKINNTSLKIVKNSNKPFFKDNYLYLQFLVQETQLWVAAAYLKLKNIEQFDPKNKEMSFFNIPSNIKSQQHLKNEIERQASLRKKMEKSSAERNIKLKFHELKSKYSLNDIEFKALQLIFIITTNLEFKIIFEKSDIDFWRDGFRSDKLEVGLILSILSRNNREQHQYRYLFSLNNPLIRHELILLFRFRSFYENEVKMHERISNFCIDDENIYDPDLSCISIDRPSIKIENVILKDKYKKDLLTYCEAFISSNKQNRHIGNNVDYGSGLTCLFYGLSGTGKTMLAHGLANHFNLKLYSINIGSLEQSDISFEDAVKHIFREARLSDGIVFLDECDDLLNDNSYRSRTFLIEIEKANCITILATNKTIKMDPALDRRISIKIPFKLHTEKERLLIWKSLLPEGIKFAKDVNLTELASKFEFTGGLIKNSILMAVQNTQLKNKTSYRHNEIGMSEILKAVQYQVNSMFDLNSPGEIIQPEHGLENLNLCRIDKDKISNIKTLIPDFNKKSIGFCCLVSTNSIAIGIKCVEAIAKETGLQLRKFSMESVMSSDPQKATLDPVTQEPLKLIDYILKKRPGQKEIVLVDDKSNILHTHLEEQRKGNTNSNWMNFLSQIRSFKGTLFVVSKQLDNQLVPLEFGYHLPLTYPPEDLQIKTWKHHFPNFSESCLIDIVENYPLYIEEIELVANNITISSQVNGNTFVSPAKIHQTIKRIKKVRSLPPLFGNKNESTTISI